MNLFKISYKTSYKTKWQKIKNWIWRKLGQPHKQSEFIMVKVREKGIKPFESSYTFTNSAYSFEYER